MNHLAGSTPRLALALALISAFGCCKRQPKPEAAPAPEEPRETTEAVLSDLRGSAGALAPAPAPAPPTAPSYSVPSSCEPRYQFRAEVTLSQRPAKGYKMNVEQDKVLVEVAGEATARGREGLLELVNGLVTIHHQRGEARKLAFQHAAGGLAAVILQPVAGGASFEEKDGPATLWAAFGNFPGLSVFFPPLPRAPEAGAQAPWTLPLYREGSALGTEVRRGQRSPPEDGTIPQAIADLAEGQASLVGWATAGGARLALLGTRWEVGDPTKDDPEAAKKLPPGVASRSHGKFRGRHAILDGGLPLWGRVRGENVVRIKLPSKALDLVLEQVAAVDAELRLVDSCGGPTVPAFPATPKAAEGDGGSRPDPQPAPDAGK